MLNVVACAILAASAPAVKSTYDGPLGLRWGQTPDQVKAALDGRLTLQEENATGEKSGGLLYTGEFAGFATDGVAIVCDDQGLAAVVVALQAADTRPASRKWLDVVETMKKKYGEPSESSPPPKLPAQALSRAAPRKSAVAAVAEVVNDIAEATRYEWQDEQIRSGAWVPGARWTFANGALISVQVKSDQPDEHGLRVLRVAWMFVRSDSVIKTPSPSSDF